jgi:dipeptidyl aminopeptidase/acylaminoacyl peptidase
MRQLILVFTGLLLTAVPGFAQDIRTIEPADYYRVETVGNTALSPDGRHLLYTVQTNRRQENDRITHVWWADLETGTNRRLSSAGVNSTNPGWTPDGRRVHFSTTRGSESGLHFLNFTQPGGEAYRIPGISGSPNFAPDGSWVLTSRQVDVETEGADDDEEDASGAPEGRERADRQSWPSGTPALTGPTATSTRGQTEAERNRDVYVIEHSNYKRDGNFSFVGPNGGGGGGFGGFGGASSDGSSFTQFFRVPADGLPEGQDPVQLTFDPMNKNFQSFSADGRWILYTVNLTAHEEMLAGGDEAEEEEADDDEEEMPRMGIYRIPSSGGDAIRIHEVQGGVRGVRMSPDGRRVSFALTKERQTDPVLHVVNANDGALVAEIGADWKYGIGTAEWTPNSRELVWSTSVGGHNQVVKAAASGGPVTFVTEGGHSLGSVSFDSRMRRMAYAKSTAERPWEAYVADIDGSNERQVSTANDEWLAQVRLSRVERFTYEGVPHNAEWLKELKSRGVDYMLANNAPSGERPEIEGWLVYPTDYEPGVRYPLVLSIHGGPHSRYADTWFHEFQMLAAQGMFVLYTNPRGSSGYGQEFTYMTMEAWGIDDTKDVLQAVDIAVERGLADPDRLGIAGGSYGGFMTNWITAHDQRFAAAVSDRSISNWISFYGVSDASGLVEREFGGMPWPYNDPEEGSFLLATMLSPIVWADRVNTPTMVIHSINDYRTPLEGGEQWFRALQKHDVEVRMVLFPDTSHGLSRTGEPWLLVRRLDEYMNWFRSKLVEPATAGVTADAGAGAMN